MKAHTYEIYQQYEYDKEWIDLIIQAKQIGLSTIEVRNFLNHMQHHEPTANPKYY